MLSATPRPLRIAPSLLAADFSCLGTEVEAIEAAGADWLHIDVMDGHFVPNLTMGPDIVRALRKKTSLPFDVHLMTAPADPWLEAFAQAGADILTVHVEAGPNLHRSLQTIRKLGKKVGVALNPATPACLIEPVLPLIDLVLCMSVNPGFGGQSFLPEICETLLRVKAMAAGWDIDIEVDGGITPQTAPLAGKAGANILVAGSAVFRSSDYAQAIANLRETTSQRPFSTSI
jgi:ribulose-phosphate 3-epimerase